MPRRYADHRKVEARPFRAAYDALAERYPPTDRLARLVTGIAADLVVEYERLAQSRRQTPRAASARRKTAGLILGALRAVADGANGRGHAGPDIAATLAAMRDEGTAP